MLKITRKSVIYSISTVLLAGLLIYVGFGVYNYAVFRSAVREVNALGSLWQDGGNKIKLVSQCVTDTMCDQSGCKQCGITCPYTTLDYPAPYTCAAYMQTTFIGQNGATHVSTIKGCPQCLGSMPMAGGQIIAAGTWHGNPSRIATSIGLASRIDRAVEGIKVFIAGLK